MNPEIEVHSVCDDPKERCGDELADGKHEVAQASDPLEQNVEAERSCKTKGPIEYDTLSALENSEFDNCDFGSLYTWSDDEHSEMDEVGLGVYDSILAIRKEASKMNAVMAVDQLDRLNDEIRNMRRELSDQSAEMNELQTLAQLKDDRIGTLELERDLYKADTDKLANDLESCLVKLRQVSGTALDPTDGDFEMDENIINVASNTTSQRESKPMPFRDVRAAETSTQSICKASHPERLKGPLDPPSCAESSPTATSQTSTSTSPPMCRSVIPLSPISAFEKPRMTNATTRTNASRSVSRPRRARGIAFAFCRSASQPLDKLPDSGSNEPKPGIQQEHIQEMTLRLMSALATSEELRRRLAKLHCYYESLVSQLRKSLVETKADRAQIEFSFTRHLSTMQREYRGTLAESKMGEQDGEEIVEAPNVPTFEA